MTSPAPLPPVLEELKPCPFCGSSNVDPEGWAALGTRSTRHGPACDDCGASAESVAAWNRRAPDTALLEQVKEGERAKEALRPFAATGAALDPKPRDEACWAGQRPAPPITYGHLREAARTLAALSQPQEDSHV